jgi:hypothetical protein
LHSSARATKEREANRAGEGAARRMINGAQHDIKTLKSLFLRGIIDKVLVLADKAGPNDETLGRGSKKVEGIARNQCQRV